MNPILVKKIKSLIDSGVIKSANDVNKIIIEDKLDEMYRYMVRQMKGSHIVYNLLNIDNNDLMCYIIRYQKGGRNG